MPLPTGFKVNGAKVKNIGRIPIPPRVQKIMGLLDKLPSGELVTSLELTERLAISGGGAAFCASILLDYREKVDNKLFWGSRKSVAQLRKQLVTPEETHDES